MDVLMAFLVSTVVGGLTLWLANAAVKCAARRQEERRALFELYLKSGGTSTSDWGGPK